MSTILDALRKLEEEQQSRTADARSRLLLSSVYRTRSPRSRPSRWKLSAWSLGIFAFVLAGFAAGAGVMLWRPHSETLIAGRLTDPSGAQGMKNKRAAASASPATPTTKREALETEKEREAPLRQPPTPPQPSAETTPAPPVATNTRETFLAASVESAPRAPASGQASTDSAFAAAETTLPKEKPLTEASIVQRSPFITTPPAPKETPSAQREVATAVKHSTEPAARTPKASDGATYEVLLPSGATRLVKPPTSASTKVEEPAAPSGTSLSLLQWSSDPEKRLAFIRVNGGALTMAHEGDTVGGYKVVEIRQNAVELELGETHLTLHAR